MEYRDVAPAEWNTHWDAMPNSVRALYSTFRSTGFLRREKEVLIEARGQLCFDEAAARATAYHMHNNGMRTGWEFISWRCEMDGPLIGRAKLAGGAPPNFDIYDYVPRRHAKASQ